MAALDRFNRGGDSQEPFLLEINSESSDPDRLGLIRLNYSLQNGPATDALHLPCVHVCGFGVVLEFFQGIDRIKIKNQVQSAGRCFSKEVRNDRNEAAQDFCRFIFDHFLKVHTLKGPHIDWHLSPDT